MLADGLEVTGLVLRLVPGPPRAGGCSTLLAVLDGPVLVSRDGRSLLQEPWAGSALVAFGPAASAPAGPFSLALPGGLG